VVSSLPICVTNDPAAAKESAAKAFQVYGVLPVYRACLDAEGASGPADIALIGDEKVVRAGLERMRDAGASDFYAAIFPDKDGPRSAARSYELLKSLGGRL
jgi:alkanesulfonate monooxygenase SsuD/methylene tetrahydromethanopterin reductase-like flavin-dependent oxidoreductase (luciferase family)